MPAAAPGLIRRTVKHRRSNRGRRLSPRATPINVQSSAGTGSTLTVVFDQPVGVTGIPKYPRSDTQALPTAASLSSANTLVLTYAATIGMGVSVQVPFEDPAIRNSTGGYVTPQAMAA